MSKVTKTDVDYTGIPVDKNGRKSNISMFMVMLGFTFFSASMWVGQQLAAGLDWRGFVWALILGGAILAAYTGALGWIGAESGMSLDQHLLPVVHDAHMDDQQALSHRNPAAARDCASGFFAIDRINIQKLQLKDLRIPFGLGLVVLRLKVYILTALLLPI